MSVYIEGMNIPKKGRFTSFTVYHDGRVVYRIGGTPAGTARQMDDPGKFGWVNVKDVTPNDRQCVIVFSKKYGVGEALYSAPVPECDYPEMWFFVREYGDQLPEGDVEWWMPMPVIPGVE